MEPIREKRSKPQKRKIDPGRAVSFAQAVLEEWDRGRMIPHWLWKEIVRLTK